MTKDWTGNSKSTFVTLGASNHVDRERPPEDYFATDPKAVELLLEAETFSDTIWEPACGGGHISRTLEAHGHNVISTDLVYRGYGSEDSTDFLKVEAFDFNGDIITNPPYRYALEFVQKAVNTVKYGHKVAMLLRLQFLEGKARRKFFIQSPPKTVYVFSSRMKCAMNGEFDSCGSSAIAYAWFVWEKGYTGAPIIKWIG